MEWVWELYRKEVTRHLARRGVDRPTDAQQQEAFVELLRTSTVTVLVQEPWRGAVRFKGLARYDVPDALELLRDPQAYLAAHFGGGKFKLNFHRGWHFVATQNFKPEGAPRWKELPPIAY